MSGNPSANLKMFKPCYIDHSSIKPWQVSVEIKNLANGGEHLKGVCKFCGVFIKFLSKAEVKQISKIKEKLANRKIANKKSISEFSAYLIFAGLCDGGVKEDTDKISQSIFKFLHY